MTTATSPTPSTAVAAPVAKALSPAAAEAQALRKMTVEIRGQQWGASCSPEVQWAVARYCLRNGLDAVRHVEVLGGRIYLTAEFYREAGAELLLDGTVVPMEPQNIAKDQRLELLSKRDDETGAWARAEDDRRLRARIAHGVDEEAPGAAIVRFVLRSGAVVVGVNWINPKRKDPVGLSEPTKTAITRAERRAWRQVIEAVPSFRDKVQPIEASAKLATAEVAEIVTTEVKQLSAARPASAGTMGGATYRDPEPIEAPAPIDEEARLAAVALDARMVALEEREDRGERLTGDEAEDLRQWRMDRDETAR